MVRKLHTCRNTIPLAVVQLPVAWFGHLFLLNLWQMSSGGTEAAALTAAWAALEAADCFCLGFDGLDVFWVPLLPA